MRKLIVPLEYKLSEDGTLGSFKGYASIFGNEDLGGDIVDPGAFKEFVSTPTGDVVMLFNHNAFSFPVGSASVTQDEKGLAFDGKLVMEDPQARVLLAHMKAKTIHTMSIGYDILPGGAYIDDNGVQHLTALKLWEISPVVFAMNPQAAITDVKAVDAIGNVVEFERFLHAAGFSRQRSKQLARHGWAKGEESARDAHDDDSREVAQMVAELAAKFNH
jgi:HK97 family phage prohead protease